MITTKPTDSAARRGRRLRLSPLRLLGAAGAVVLGVLGATSAAAGSYAYLNAQAPAGAVSSITAGTAGLTIQPAGGTAGSSVTLPSAAWSGMLPGDVNGQTVTVKNTGDTPLSVTARLGAVSGWNIRVATGSCPASVLGTSALTTTGSTWSALAAGASATLCVQAELPAGASNALQGTSPGIVLTLDGTQTP